MTSGSIQQGSKLLVVFMELAIDSGLCSRRNVMALNSVQSTEEITPARTGEGTASLQGADSKMDAAPPQEASAQDDFALGSQIDSNSIKESKADSTNSPIGRAVDFRV